MEHVVWLGARGLDLRLEGDRLLVSPEYRITPEVDRRIRRNRESIVATLADPDPWRSRRELYGRLARGEEPAELSAGAVDTFMSTTEEVQR
jgi:hypothetical protein